jgi:toxin ParE1/3/4
MSRRVRVRPRAEADIKEQFQYFARISTELAVRFSTQIDMTFKSILASPDVGIRFSSVHDATTDLRISKVQKFSNHLVICRGSDTGVEVVRVLHRARNIEGLFKAGEIS